MHSQTNSNQNWISPQMQHENSGLMAIRGSFDFVDAASDSQ